MKKNLAIIMALSMLLSAAPVIADDHGSHGSHGSMEHSSSQAQVENPNARDSEVIINNCYQYVGRINQRIQRLQMDIKGKHVTAPVRDELIKLEQNLKEANDIIRSLQIL